MQPLQPPTPITAALPRPWLFLAGAIDQDRAERWQDVVCAALEACHGTILNPRCAAWNTSWVQSLDNPQFAGQVAWELDGLEQADAILCWLPATAQARISLLEIGLHARGGRLLIGCAPGFDRRGNIMAIAARFAVPVYDTLEQLVAAARARLAAATLTAAYTIGSHP